MFLSFKKEKIDLLVIYNTIDCLVLVIFIPIYLEYFNDIRGMKLWFKNNQQVNITMNLFFR